jgi:hypothetical protein
LPMHHPVVFPNGSKLFGSGTFLGSGLLGD